MARHAVAALVRVGPLSVLVAALAGRVGQLLVQPRVLGLGLQVQLVEILFVV